MKTKSPIALEFFDSCIFIAHHMILSARATKYPDAVREYARDYLTRAYELACWHPPQMFPHVEIKNKSGSKSNVTINMGGD